MHIRYSTAFSAKISSQKVQELQKRHEQSLLHRINCCQRTSVEILTYGNHPMLTVQSTAGFLARWLYVLRIWLRKRMAHHKTVVWVE